MKQTYTTIDYDWLICPTGDQFADVGGYVIKYLSEKFPEKDILELIEYMADVYVKEWDGKINTFFLNSSITQPAFKGNVKIDETLKYFSSLLNEAASSETGYCRISGRKTKLFKAGRNNSIMTGSGTFVNFHHNFQEGVMLSKEIIIRLFFVPFGVVSVGGKIAIIHSNISDVNEYFIQQNCEKNIAFIGNRSEDGRGVLKSGYNIPVNALFRFIDDLFVREMGKFRNEKNLMLNLYHFTNFGASPEIVIYRLPVNVFRFYSSCKKDELRDDWQKFVFAHYRNSKFKNAKFNESTLQYEETKKKEIEKIGFDDYKTWRNIVLEKLLNNESLLILFLKWIKKHAINLTIIELYLKEIRNMRKETIEKIKELAAFLTDEDWADDSTIKKTIKALDGSNNAYELRRFLLNRVVANNYNMGTEKPIVTLDEYANYLFPDDVSWRDIRIVLLIAIYEQLHIKRIDVNKDGDLLELEEETTVE